MSHYSTNTGWVKLPRDLLESALFRNPRLLKVYVWCLLKASYRHRTVIVGRRKVDIEPGQFIFGRHAAAEALGMPASTVWDYMRLLQDEQQISINSDNKYSLVTIANWDLWQSEENISDSKWTTDPTTNGHKQESKNIRIYKPPLTPPEGGRVDKGEYSFEELEDGTSLLDNPKRRLGAKEIKDSFEEFWSLYPKKKAKGRAEKAWKKIDPDSELKQEIIAALERAKRSPDWQKSNGQYIPYPASWLNAKGWLDEDGPRGRPSEITVPIGKPMPKITIPIGEWRA